MTRDESKSKLWQSGNINTLSKVECNQLIDKIYDDFESRICENCRFYKEEEEIEELRVEDNYGWCDEVKEKDNYGWCAEVQMEIMPLLVDRDFGCNKFEPKE